MYWFGFGFNAFGQICSVKGDAEKEVKVSSPIELKCRENKNPHGCLKINKVSVCWSCRASLHLHGEKSCVCLAGIGASESGSCCVCVVESQDCKDASVSDSHLTLLFQDRIESWDLQNKEKSPSWSMKITTPSDQSDFELPLVPGGYIASKPPFFHSLPSHLQVKSLALGGEHAIFLTTTGAVYTLGQGSHGQLGHGGLISEKEPKTVEALWGMPMSFVAAGGWHSVCISDGGDLYVWGWNESGQLGLPSKGLSKESQRAPDPQAGELHQVAETSGTAEKDKDVFISIQAFPALVDVSPSCELRTISCGSRHTAAVTTKGELYTWGWGEYGQLGHETLESSDEPQCVEFFQKEKMHVMDVVCGPWNTFTMVVKKGESRETPVTSREDD